MENPLKELRLELHYTPNQLARVANIQMAAVGQMEDGLYPQPIPSYLIACGIRIGSRDHELLTKEYHEYQLAKRISNGPNYNPKLSLDPNFSTNQHPLLSWRNQSSLAVYGFCSAFCIHMPTVNNFEKNIMKIRENPPKGVTVPLLQAGYDLSEFTEACELYRSSLLGTIRAANGLVKVA